MSARVLSKSYSAAASVEVVVSLMARPFFLTAHEIRELAHDVQCIELPTPHH